MESDQHPASSVIQHQAQSEADQHDRTDISGQLNPSNQEQVSGSIPSHNGQLHAVDNSLQIYIYIYIYVKRIPN